MDKVVVPQELEAGQYTLSFRLTISIPTLDIYELELCVLCLFQNGPWLRNSPVQRWDCEQTSQIWSACASVELVWIFFIQAIWFENIIIWKLILWISHKILLFCWGNDEKIKHDLNNPLPSQLWDPASRNIMISPRKLCTPLLWRKNISCLVTLFSSSLLRELHSYTL